MKVILLQDVSKIGSRFEIVEVPNGYAMNRLIPKGLAKPATPENVKKISAQNAHKEEVVAHKAEDFKSALDKIKDTTITVKVETNDQGHMFEALKSDVVSRSLALHGVTISESQIVIPQPIKETGEYEIQLKEGELESDISIKVEKNS